MRILQSMSAACIEYLDENVTAAGVMETIRTTGDLKPETEEQLKQAAG